MSTPRAAFCAIDFGTSNSAIAIPAPDDAGQTGMRLVPLEGAHLTMPTAVFYATDADDLDHGEIVLRCTHHADRLSRRRHNPRPDQPSG